MLRLVIIVAVTMRALASPSVDRRITELEQRVHALENPDSENDHDVAQSWWWGSSDEDEKHVTFKDGKNPAASAASKWRSSYKCKTPKCNAVGCGAYARGEIAEIDEMYPPGKGRLRRTLPQDMKKKKEMMQRIVDASQYSTIDQGYSTTCTEKYYPTAAAKAQVTTTTTPPRSHDLRHMNASGQVAMCSFESTHVRCHAPLTHARCGGSRAGHQPLDGERIAHDDVYPPAEWRWRRRMRLVCLPRALSGGDVTSHMHMHMHMYMCMGMCARYGRPYCWL